MKQKSFKLAMIQMFVEGGSKSQNLEHASALIAEAATNNAQVVLLPECMDLGWTHPSAETEAESVPGGTVYERLRESAMAHHVYVCAGITELDAGHVYNSAILISPEGSLLLKHRKLNELDIAHHLYGQGDRLNVADTEWGRFGIMICADARARHYVLSRSLCYMGADVILSPSSWAVPPDYDHVNTPYGNDWRSAYATVAQEFSVPIFGVSNVGPIAGGPWQGWNCIGSSLGVDAMGREIVHGPYGVGCEVILYTDVAPLPRPARGTQWGS